MKHAAWFDGFDAFLREEPIDSNPECPGHPAFWAWRDGWFAAELGQPRPEEPKPPPPPVAEI